MTNYSFKFMPTADTMIDLKGYCELYNIPIDHFIEIISDQKVVPMIRGKALEYSAYDFLRQNLSSDVWDVIKENLNAQPNSPDEDLKIIHLPSGVNIHIEVKSAVRNSFTLGSSRHKIKEPHFKVKSHRSRSNFNNLANDRYLSSDFDIIISNPSNSLLESGEDFNMVSDVLSKTFLEDFYNVMGPIEIFKSSCEDIIFVKADDIKEQFKGLNVIPRTPTVRFANEPHWKKIQYIEQTLNEIVLEKS